jgi:hypothetical protein
MKKNFLFLLLTFSAAHLFANVSLPRIFGDNMVLQSEHLFYKYWQWLDGKEWGVERF